MNQWLAILEVVKPICNEFGTLWARLVIRLMVYVRCKVSLLQSLGILPHRNAVVLCVSLFYITQFVLLSSIVSVNLDGYKPNCCGIFRWNIGLFGTGKYIWITNDIITCSDWIHTIWVMILYVSMYDIITRIWTNPQNHGSNYR